MFFISLGMAIAIVVAKFAMHTLGWEVVDLGSLHTSVFTGAFFVLGFLLSATISDYKESEKIPAEFAGNVQNMYEDAVTMSKRYPEFDLAAYRKQLIKVLETFRDDVRDRAHNAHHEVHRLSASLLSMEDAGVPPNFITKVKQEQAQLAKSLLRVNYIQTITFLPSATVLARCIVVLAVGVLLFTDVEPFYGGMLLTGVISLIFIYVLGLMRVISVPFQRAGTTKDDVSMYLIGQAIEYLRKER